MNIKLLNAYLEQQHIDFDTLLSTMEWDQSILDDVNHDKHITLRHIKKMKKLLNLTHNEVLMLFEINTSINAPLLHLSYDEPIKFQD